MSKKLITFAAAIAVAVVTALPASAQTNGLPTATAADLGNGFQSSDKPAIVVFVSPTCTNCPAAVEALAKQQAKHPEVKIFQANASEVGVPDTSLPFVAVAVPGLAITYRKANFDPATADAFVTKRADVAIKEVAQIAVVKSLEDKIDAASKPFDDQLEAIDAQVKTAVKPVQDKADKALAPLKAKAQDIQARAEKALGTLPQDLENAKTAEEAAKIQAQIEEKVKPFNDEMVALKAQATEIMKPLREEAAGIMKPFKEQVDQVNAKKEAALSPLNAEYEKASAALDALTKQDEDAPAPADKK